MRESYVEQYLDLWRNHWWWRARHRFVLRHLEELSARRGGRRDLKILDIGCCGGVGFDDWASYGEVWGIEPDEHLAASTPKWTHRVTNTSLEAFEAPSGAFDLVILLDVLEHIENDAAALEGIGELLAPGGSLLLTVPALPLLWSAHDEANHHFRRYIRGDLRRRLIDAAFDPVRLDYFFTWSTGLLLLRRLVARRAGSYRVRRPPKPAGALLEALCGAENRIFRTLRIPPPFGSSLIAVADRSSRT